MTRPPDDLLSDADLEGVVGGKAMQRDRSTESRKPSRAADSSPAPKLDRALDRQNQNANSNSN